MDWPPRAHYVWCRLTKLAQLRPNTHFVIDDDCIDSFVTSVYQPHAYSVLNEPNAADSLGIDTVELLEDDECFDIDRLVDYNCEQCMNELRQVVGDGQYQIGSV